MLQNIPMDYTVEQKTTRDCQTQQNKFNILQSKTRTTEQARGQKCLVLTSFVRNPMTQFTVSSMELLTVSRVSSGCWGFS